MNLEVETMGALALARPEKLPPDPIRILVVDS